MAERIKVTYSDGRTEIVKVTPRAQVEAERHFKGLKEEIALQGSYWLAWFALGKLGKESAPFDDWLDLIEDAENITADEDLDAEDPTAGGTPTPAESSNSPLPPESDSTS